MTVTSHILLYSACASNISSSPVSSLFAQPFSKDTPGLYKDDPASPVRYCLFSRSHRAEPQEPKPILTIPTEVVAHRDHVHGILAVTTACQVSRSLMLVWGSQQFHTCVRGKSSCSCILNGCSASVFGFSRVELRHIINTSIDTLQVGGGVLLHGA